jgi:membrane protease YdiL (CAAX protease family)
LIESPPAPDGPSGTSPAAPGLFRFTIDGRQAPGLFVAGWIGTLIGGAAAFVGLLSGANLAGALLFIGGLALVLVGLVLLGGSQAVERRHAGLAYAGPSPIITFLAVVTGWYLATVVVATPLQLAGLDLAGPGLSLLGVTIQGLVVIGILGLMVVGPGALSWREMGVRRPDGAALRDLAWGAVFAAPVVVVTGVAVLALVSVIGQQPASPLPPTGSPGGLALNLLSGAVIAPFYEELFFRGFTLTAWRRMAGPAAALIRSAVLFAFIHAIDQTGSTFAAALGVAVVAAAARLPVALVLGWVFDRRGSLWASIGLHAAFNAILLVIAERAFQS